MVVDEAHHGFGQDTVAAKFFRDVLRPEYTVLITATPDDAEVKEFEAAMEIAELQRISVSRADVVDAGLIEKGVKCAAYFVEPGQRALVDLQGTALRDGVAAHRKLKRSLADLKVPLAPLLLVQADSTEKSVDKLRERLLRMGFTNEQIAVHTAAEPDENLLALANDDTREVLVFKMAVALGFDAPRPSPWFPCGPAATPTSACSSWGGSSASIAACKVAAQAKTLPEQSRYGYVFLADAETQTGLEIAGQKINQIQTRYAQASTATVAMRFGDGLPGVGIRDESGQLPLFRLEGGEPGAEHDAGEEGTAAAEFVPNPEFDFGTFFGGSPAAPDDGRPRPGGRSRSPVLWRRTVTSCVRACRGVSRPRW